MLSTCLSWWVGVFPSSSAAAAAGLSGGFHNTSKLFFLFLHLIRILLHSFTLLLPIVLLHWRRFLPPLCNNAIANSHNGKLLLIYVDWYESNQSINWDWVEKEREKKAKSKKRTYRIRAVAKKVRGSETGIYCSTKFAFHFNDQLDKTVPSIGSTVYAYIRLLDVKHKPNDMLT